MNIMYQSSAVRLQRPEERDLKLAAMERIRNMMRGVRECTVVEPMVASAKAPDANYEEPASLIMVSKQVVKRGPTEYIIEAPHDTIIIQKRELAAYFYCRMYLSQEKRDEHLYNSLIRFAVQVKHPYPTPPVATDGQLKILVDFAIGVDHFLQRNPTATKVNITVVGSSSESGRASTAYGLLQHAGYDVDFDVHLYDPYEADGVEYQHSRGPTNERRNIAIHHHRKLFCYRREDCQNIDLLFDDAYVIHRDIRYAHRQEIDPDHMYRTIPDYSIKRLLGDEQYFSDDYDSSTYEQSLITHASELRMTRYPRHYSEYVDHDLGSCSACVELGYMVSGPRPSKWSEYVLRAHHTSCSRRIHRLVSNPPCCDGVVCISGHRMIICSRHNSGRYLKLIRRRPIDIEAAYMTIDRVPDLHTLSRQTIILTLSATTGGDQLVTYTTARLIYDYEVRYLNSVYLVLPSSNLALVSYLDASDVPEQLPDIMVLLSMRTIPDYKTTE